MALVLIKSVLRSSEHRYHRVPAQTEQELEKRSDNRSSMSIYGLVPSFPGSEKTTKDGSESGSFFRSRVSPRVISDLTIGLSDGLTVPFALTAGLSALGDSSFVIYGGIAELIAGSISMGLGGYLGAKGESEAYQAALAQTQATVDDDRPSATVMIHETFAKYDFPKDTLDSMVSSLLSQPDNLTDFLMRFHGQLAEADYAPSRAYISGLTIAAGYFFGGLVPLLPYLCFAQVHRAFIASVLVMALALFTFGWTKTALVGDCSAWMCLKNAVQMLVLGGIAAGAAMTCVKAIGG